jgi:hypothetical protein
MNIRTTVLIISTIEKIPIDQASLEAVLGFILAVDSVRSSTVAEAWGHDSVTGATTGPPEC